MQLQGMAMNEKESFKEYAQRWRELAAQVEPPLSEKKMTGIFVDTLNDPFFDKFGEKCSVILYASSNDWRSHREWLKGRKNLRSRGSPPMHRKSILEASRRKEKVIQMLYLGVIMGSNKLHMAKSPPWCPYPTSKQHNNNMFISNNPHNNGNNRMSFHNESSSQGHHEGSLTLCMCLIAIYSHT